LYASESHIGHIELLNAVTGVRKLTIYGGMQVHERKTEKNSFGMGPIGSANAYSEK